MTLVAPLPPAHEPIRRVLASFPGVRLALLFGSYARGVATSESDVDVAVLARDVDLLSLGAALSLAVDREVDVIDLDEATIPMLEELIRDPVVVHEGAAAAFALWRSRVLAQLEIDGPWYARMRDAWLARVAAKGL